MSLGPQYSPDGRWYWNGQQWLPTGAPASASTLYNVNAGFLLRFGAAIIDYLICWFASLFISIPLNVGAAALDQANGSSTGGTWSFIASLANFAIWTIGVWLYFSVQEASSAQATIGKRALGIMVTDYQGRRLGFGRATARYFAKYLSLLICYVGFLMVAFTERRQGPHDILAGTLVVRNQPGYATPQASNTAAVVVTGAVGFVLVLVLVSIVVIVILLTMGGQIKNVFSNVVVALNS